MNNDEITKTILEFAQNLPQQSDINTYELLEKFLDKTYDDAKILYASLKGKDQPMDFCASWIVIMKLLNIATIQGMEILKKFTQENATEKEVDEIYLKFIRNINIIQRNLDGFDDGFCMLPKK